MTVTFKHLASSSISNWFYIKLCQTSNISAVFPISRSTQTRVHFIKYISQIITLRNCHFWNISFCVANFPPVAHLHAILYFRGYSVNFKWCNAIFTTCSWYFTLLKPFGCHGFWNTVSIKKVSISVKSTSCQRPIHQDPVIYNALDIEGFYFYCLRFFSFVKTKVLVLLQEWSADTVDVMCISNTSRQHESFNTICYRFINAWF